MTSMAGNVRVRGRRGNRRQRSNPVSTKFNWQSRQNDAILFRGSVEPFAINTPATGLQTFSFALSTENMGARCVAVAGLYLRYRINALRIRYVSSVSSTTAGVVIAGVADDADNVSIGTTLTPDQLRISNTNSVWKDFTLEWTPTDKQKWYYTNQTTFTDTTSDPRFNQPATLLFQCLGTPVSTSLGYVYIEYEMIFKGAAPINIV